MKKMPLVVKNRPGKYPITSQQLKFKKITEICGIKKGMSKRDLQKAMKDCVGPLMRGEKIGEDKRQDLHTDA